MTPRERAEAAKDDWIGDGTGWLDTELKELQDIIEAAITEHVRAVLADDEATIDAIEAAWEHEPELWRRRHAAQAALAALRRKAGVE